MNSDSNFIVSAFGELRTISDWADLFFLDEDVLWDRIVNQGMDPKEALTTPTDAEELALLLPNN